LFQQTSAPTGWTKSTTHDNKALRVVSGGAGSGGSSAFTAVLNGGVDATTLTTDQIPSHNHQMRFHTAGSSGGGNIASNSLSTGTVNFNLFSASAGGGGSHTHSMDVAYVDVIIATKN